MAPKRSALLWLSTAGLLAAPAAVAQIPDSRATGPFFLTVQLAGGAGRLAVGGGYWLAGQRLEPALLVGLLPRRDGTPAMSVFTLKTTYTPYAAHLGRSHWWAGPLSFGGQVSYTAGPGLNASRDDKYRKGYYWWSAHTRIGAFVGARLTHASPADYWPRRTVYYAELGTNDLYLVSKITNRSLRLAEILTLGLGVKAGR